MNTTEFASAMSYFPVEERAAVLDKYIIINMRPWSRVDDEVTDDDFPEWKTELIHVDDFKNTCINAVDDSYYNTTRYSIGRKDHLSTPVTYCIWGAVLNEHKIENPWPSDGWDVIGAIDPDDMFEEQIRNDTLNDVEKGIDHWDDTGRYISREDLKQMLELP